MKRHVSFELEADDKSSKQWSMSLAFDGTKVVFGLHWNDKPHPTHTFSATMTELEKAIAELKS